MAGSALVNEMRFGRGFACIFPPPPFEEPAPVAATSKNTSLKRRKYKKRKRPKIPAIVVLEALGSLIAQGKTVATVEPKK
jgi:hypothetical protein